MLKPLNSRVVIEPDKKEEATSSGILLPSSAQEKSATGVIVVGGELVQEGQRVLFSKFSFDEVTIDGRQLYLVSESNLLGIFE